MNLGLYEKETLRLPHPQISLPVLLIIQNALIAAWRIVRDTPRRGFNLSTATEDSISLELHEALVDRVFNRGVVPGFDAKIFSAIVREPKIRNFNYTHPDKMPDLLVMLVNRPAGIITTQDGLFIECKPVDKQHGIKQHYCTKGLKRFLTGDYAWAMPNAMMVGYARPGYTISPKLQDALKSMGKTLAALSPLRPCRGNKATLNSDRAQTSRHARKFKYRENGMQAGPITIHHLWLKRE